MTVFQCFYFCSFPISFDLKLATVLLIVTAVNKWTYKEAVPAHSNGTCISNLLRETERPKVMKCKQPNQRANERQCINLSERLTPSPLIRARPPDKQPPPIICCLRRPLTSAAVSDVMWRQWWRKLCGSSGLLPGAPCEPTSNIFFCPRLMRTQSAVEACN